MICGSAQHNESAPGGATMVMNYRGAGLNRNEGIGFSYVQHGSLHEKDTFLNGRLLELFCEAVAPEGNDNPSYTGVLTLEVGELFDKIIVSLNNGEYTIELDGSEFQFLTMNIAGEMKYCLMSDRPEGKLN